MRPHFLEPDDYILIMDVPGRFLSSEDLKSLRSVGCKTVYPLSIINWDEISPTPSILDLSEVDRYVDKVLNTGMKVLIPLYFTPAKWVSGYFTSAVSHATYPNLYYGVSFSDKKGLEQTIEFVSKCKEHFAPLIDVVECINSMPYNGEWIMPPYVSVPYNKNDIINFYTECQKVFADTPYNEIWTAMHKWFAPSGFFAACNFIDDIYTSYRNNLPNVTINGIQFTHFWDGEDKHNREQAETVKKTADQFNITFFCGSNFCEGLMPHMESSLKYKTRYITGPTHPFTRHTRLEPWMLPVFEQAIAAFKKGLG